MRFVSRLPFTFPISHITFDYSRPSFLRFFFSGMLELTRACYTGRDPKHARDDDEQPHE